MDDVARMDDRHEVVVDKLNDEIVKIFNVPRLSRNVKWVRDRRQMRIEHVETERLQAKERQQLDENFVDMVKLAQDEHSRDVASCVTLAVYTQDAMARAVAEAEEAAKSQAEAEAASAATSQEGPMGSALDRYKAWASGGQGGHRRQGLGHCSQVPEMTRQQQRWREAEWAEWWLQLGGYTEGQEGAAQWDSEGWLALHHACNSGHWLPQAPLVIVGLVQRMSSKRLSATTSGGRPTGHGVLHLMASHSDLAFANVKLCWLMVNKGVDPEMVDASGRTPMHHAAGTGLVDMCMALVDMQADPGKVDDFGLAPIDKCMGSSGQCQRFFGQLGYEPRDRQNMPVTRYRDAGTVSFSRNLRGREREVAGKGGGKGDGKGDGQGDGKGGGTRDGKGDGKGGGKGGGGGKKGSASSHGKGGGGKLRVIRE